MTLADISYRPAYRLPALSRSDALAAVTALALLIGGALVAFSAPAQTGPVTLDWHGNSASLSARQSR